MWLAYLSKGKETGKMERKDWEWFFFWCSFLNFVLNFHWFRSFVPHSFWWSFQVFVFIFFSKSLCLSPTVWLYLRWDNKSEKWKIHIKKLGFTIVKKKKTITRKKISIFLCFISNTITHTFLLSLALLFQFPAVHSHSFPPHTPYTSTHK